MGIEGGKQFLLLMGKPVLAHTLIAFQNSANIDSIVIVSVKENLEKCRAIAEEFEISKFVLAVEGGKERTDSVYNGLKAVRSLNDGIETIVIHDGARPLIEPQLIDDVIDGLDDYDGAIAGVPTIDTIKTVGNGVVVETLDRARTWQIQTPQAFSIEMLMRAHEAARASGYIGTDDSALIERIGGHVKVVAGARENLKITTPEDLLIAETILKTR
jgi:2-C-methyl-D-erythritol 4-phosphate cytidylyltransferase